MSRRSIARTAWANAMKMRGGSSVASRLDRTRAELLEHWGDGVWNWLGGVDPTTHTQPLVKDREWPAGVPLIWTTDEKDNDRAVLPYLPTLEYLKRLAEVCVSTDPTDRIIFIDKARQMRITTNLLLAFDWWCRFKPSRRILWSKISEEQAAEQLNDKVRAVQRRLPEWVQAALPIRPRPAKRLVYPGTESYFLGVNQDAAAGAARGGTASAIGVDEASYQDQAEGIFDAAQPMAGKIVFLTTALVGQPGAGFFWSKIRDGRVYTPASPSAA